MTRANKILAGYMLGTIIAFGHAQATPDDREYYDPSVAHGFSAVFWPYYLSDKIFEAIYE